MARIPVYERQTAARGAVAGGMSAPRIENPGAGLADLGRGMANLAEGVGAVETQQELAAARAREDDAAMQASQQLSIGRAYWFEELKARGDKYDPAQGPFQETALKDYDKWETEQLKTAATPRAGRWLKQQFGALRQHVQQDAFLFERGDRIKRNVTAFSTGVDADIKVVYQRPELRGEIIGQRLAALESLEGLEPDVKAKLKADVYDRVSLATEKGELSRDPARWYTERFGALPWAGKGGKGGGAGATGAGGPVEFNFPLRLTDASRRWIGPVNQAAERSGVDQNVLLAMLEQESKGKVDAVSPAGAVGVMQFMPPTADRFGLKDRKDPVASINAGATYMQFLLRKFDGDYEKALAGYNAGEGRVDKALQRQAKAGGSWLDYMPAETRDYVAKITANVRVPAGDAPAAPEAPVAGPRATAAPTGSEPTSWLSLQPGVQEQLRAEAERELSQRSTQQLGLLRARVENAAALAKDGHADPAPITEAEFAAAGPEGAALGRRYQVSQSLAGAVRSYKGMPGPEIEADLMAARPAPSTEGYGVAREAFSVRVAAAQAELESRQKDPAAYVLGYSTPARASWEAVSAALAPGADPAAAGPAAQAYAATMLEEQRRLGMTTAAVVPGRYVEQVVQSFRQADGSKTADLVGSMQAVWGKHWPRIVAQAGKDLPAAAVVLGDIESPAAREQVARVASIKLEDLKAGLDPKEVTAAFQEADKASGPLRLSLDPTGTGASVYGKYEEVIRRLTLSNMRGGMSAKDAAVDAYDQVIGAKYEVGGPSANPYLVPKTEDPALVERGLGALLEGLGKQPVRLPTDRLARAGGELPPGELRAQFLDGVRAAPVWVRTPDDDGLALYWKGYDGRLRRVERTDGEPLRFTWMQIRQARLEQLMDTTRVGFGRIGGSPFRASPVETAAPAGYVAP